MNVQATAAAFGKATKARQDKPLTVAAVKTAAKTIICSGFAIDPVGRPVAQKNPPEFAFAADALGKLQQELDDKDVEAVYALGIVRTWMAYQDPAQTRKIAILRECQRLHEAAVEDRVVWPALVRLERAEPSCRIA